MRKEMKLNLKEVKMMATMMNAEVKEISAIMNCKNGSRMTSTLNIIRHEGMPIINISNCKTFCFDTVEELDEYVSKKFEIFESDKEMWQTFTGMDDETWEEWNK